MMSKKGNGHKKTCETYNKHVSTNLLTKSDRSVYKVTPQAPVTSKKTPFRDPKAISSENPSTKTCLATKPKKTTRSEYCFTRKVMLKNSLDFCSECGDVVGPVPNYDSARHKCLVKDIKPKPAEKPIVISMPVERKTVNTIKQHSIAGNINEKHGQIKVSFHGSTNKQLLNIREKGVRNKQPVQQYYKNENFRQNSESTYEINNIPKKLSALDTITEVPEKNTEDTLSEHFNCQIFSDSDDFISVKENENVENVKEFRNENYFECHSAESRLKSDVSATNLGTHKCAYRFYLNDRLFPVPLYADRNETIRCIECELPLKMDDRQKSKSEDIDGIIQAKVKIGSGKDIQDMLLMLPVQEPLIIKERRLIKREVKDEVVYFGVIKLTRSGDSLFHRNIPSDSYALKYQKGYTEYDCDDLKYDRVRKGDVIII